MKALLSHLKNALGINSYLCKKHHKQELTQISYSGIYVSYCPKCGFSHEVQR